MSFIFLILVFVYFSEVSALNIGLDKETTYCETTKLESHVNDGNLETHQVIEIGCSTGLMLVTNLGGYFSVHYLITYMMSTPSSSSSLEYINVEFILNEKVYECGSYPKAAVSVRSNRGMRVNCLSWMLFFSDVVINSFYVGPINITEIEVHTLANSNKIRDKAILHRGCFSSIVTAEESKEIITCQRFCASKGFAVAALKGDTETCHCAADYDQNSEVSSDSCSKKCGSPSMPCGGTDLYSVYIVNIQLPYFYGCRKEREEKPKLMITKPDLTLEMCINRCDNYTYVIFKEGKSCWCTDDPPHERVSPDRCDSPCSGNNQQRCGSSTTYVSVYGTCKREEIYTVKCSKLFNCEGGWDEFGICQGKCQFGFSGEQCLEREYFNLIDAFSFNLKGLLSPQNLLHILVILAVGLSAGYILWSVLKNESSESGSSTSSGSSVN